MYVRLGSCAVVGTGQAVMRTLAIYADKQPRLLLPFFKKGVVMSYIPNAREKMTVTPYTDRGEKWVNSYFQGLLDESGKNTLMGFDDGVYAMNTLFDNLDAYSRDIESVFGTGILESLDRGVVNGTPPFTYPNDLDGKDVDKINPEYTNLSSYSYDELSGMSFSTKAFLLFKSILNDWVERQRDEVNTSLIEGMEKTEYEENLRELENELRTEKKEG